MTAPQLVSAGLPEPRRLRTDVGVTVAAKLLILVLGIVTSIMLARGLGAQDRGTLAVAFSATLLLVRLGSFGISTAAPYTVAREPEAVGRVVATALAAAALIGGLLIGGGVLVRALAPHVLSGVSTTEAAVAFIAIPLALAATFLQSILLGLGRVVAFNGIEFLTGLMAAGALGIGFAVLDMGVLEALCVLAGQQLLSVALYLVALRRHVQRPARPDPVLARQMMGYGLRIYVATLAGFLVIRMDMFLVNGMLGAADAGRYAVAVALADGLALIPEAVAVNLFSRVARGGSTQTSAEVFRAVALLFGAICLISLPLAGPAIDVMYGPGFAQAATLYRWLLPGIFSLGMLTILSHHFAGRGFPLEAMLVWFVGLALNLALNLLFLRSGGTYIAALSSSIAYGVLLLLHVRLFAREAGSYDALRPRFGETARMMRVAFSWRSA